MTSTLFPGTSKDTRIVPSASAIGEELDTVGMSAPVSLGVTVGDGTGLAGITLGEAVGVAFGETRVLTSKRPSTLGEVLATGVAVEAGIAWFGTTEPQADSAAMSGSETRSRTEDGEKRMENGASITRKVLKYGDVRLGFLRGMIRVMQTGLVPPSHEAMADFTVAAQ